MNAYNTKVNRDPFLDVVGASIGRVFSTTNGELALCLLDQRLDNYRDLLGILGLNKAVGFQLGGQ